jgi:apolipoprotein N-acyltransferase
VFLAAPMLGALLALALLPPAPAPGPDAPVVRLVQPNAPQHLKWREDMIPVFFQRALDLTAATPEGPPPALVVWPETTLPVLLERSDAARARIAAAAQGAQVLLGGQRFEGFRARNTSALLAPDGRIAQVYDKHHLVPFGEYMPGGAAAEALGLGGLAEVLAGGYSPGPGPALIDMGGALGRAFPMICYEAIFPGYIRQVDRPGWMVHLTNDAWFGNFSGPFQHLALARLRAAEQGLPVLRAANTGVSAVIDARGHVAAALPLNAAGFLDAALPPPLPPTVYARTGDLPALLLALLATAAALASGRWRRPLHPSA